MPFVAQGELDFGLPCNEARCQPAAWRSPTARGISTSRVPAREIGRAETSHPYMAGASLEDVSHVKGICEAATLLFRALRKVQATTARLQGMLALGACQP